ncbi:MAG: ogr/Delta-like zinc finger family protein [Kiritimatiellia bacterium]
MKSLSRWPETFATSFLRCPKCGGRLRMRNSRAVTATAHKVDYVCRTCKILIPAVAMMAKPI